MANLYFLKSDYVNANSLTDSALCEIKSELKNISSKISNYSASANNVLKGEAYSIILGRLNVYASAYEFLSEAIDVALNNMESGNNSVINAMGSFTEINSEKMQEIENEIARQKSLYSSMNEQIQSYTDEEEKNRASAINNNRYTQIKQLESDKEQLEEALVNTNNADTAGTANLTSINTTFVNFENCFMEQ